MSKTSEEIRQVILNDFGVTNDFSGGAVNDYRDDLSTLIDAFAESYRQERNEQDAKAKIGETGFGTTHPFIEALCIKLIDECEYLYVVNGKEGSVSKHIRRVLSIELNKIGINELEYTSALSPLNDVTPPPPKESGTVSSESQWIDAQLNPPSTSGNYMCYIVLYEEYEELETLEFVHQCAFNAETRFYKWRREGAIIDGVKKYQPLPKAPTS